MEEAREAFVVGGRRLREVADGAIREEHAQQGLGASDPDRDAAPVERRPQSGLHRLGRPLEFGVGIEPPGEVEGLDPRRHGDRVPAERPGLVDGADRRQPFHQVPATAERRAREPAAHDLAEGRHVRRDPEPRLGAAVADPEAGDHLVEDQDRPALGGPFAQVLEEPGHRRDDAHVRRDRLDDRRRQPVSGLGEGSTQRLSIVVRDRQRVSGRTVGHTGGARDAERRQPAPTAGGQERVRVAVVATVELQHQVAPGRGPRHPHGRHGRLGPARDEPHHVDARQRVDDAGRQLDLAFGGRAERRPLLRGGRRRGDDLRVGVSEQQRAPRADQVDVSHAVYVDDVRALAAVVEPWDATDRAERPDGRVHAARDHLTRAREQLFGSSHPPDATDAPPSLTASHPPGTLGP